MLSIALLALGAIATVLLLVFLAFDRSDSARPSAAEASARAGALPSVAAAAAQQPEPAPPREAVESQAEQVAAPPETASVTPPIEPAALTCLLLGRVVDARAQPVEGVAIQVWRADEYGAIDPASRESGLHGARAASTTDLGGGFSFQLAEGEYVLSFGDGRFQFPGLGALQLTAGTRRLDLELPALGSFVVRVVDDNDVVVSDVPLRGWCGGAGHLLLRTDADGQATAMHLPPGEYRLLASDPDLGRGDLAFVLKAGAPTQVELVLRRRALK